MEPVDPSKKHFYISLVKSGLRLIGVFMLWQAGTFMVDYPIFQFPGIMLVWSAYALGAAEVLGIVEEL